MIAVEQIAHDLAMVDLTNKYGVHVTGRFSVDSSSSNYDHDYVTDVSGDGAVSTEHFPGIDEPETVLVETDERYLLVGPRKRRRVETGEYEVDKTFMKMIRDYHAAYSRFLSLLSS